MALLLLASQYPSNLSPGGSLSPTTHLLPLSTFTCISHIPTGLYLVLWFPHLLQEGLHLPVIRIHPQLEEAWPATVYEVVRVGHD